VWRGVFHYGNQLNKSSIHASIAYRSNSQMFCWFAGKLSPVNSPQRMELFVPKVGKDTNLFEVH
jgi:hypothetical protein